MKNQRFFKEICAMHKVSRFWREGMIIRMTGEQYRKCMDFTSRYIGVGKVQMLVKLLTVVTAICYSLVILGLFYQMDSRVWQLLLMPAVGLIVVSLFRRWYSASRPYEVYGFVPLLHKDTKGKSFPSRHVFSNFMIAMAVLSVSIPMGIFLLLCGVCLAVLRVITGVHFPKDVLAGAILAVTTGVFGFFLL